MRLPYLSHLGRKDGGRSSTSSTSDWFRFNLRLGPCRSIARHLSHRNSRSLETTEIWEGSMQEKFRVDTKAYLGCMDDFDPVGENGSVTARDAASWGKKMRERGRANHAMISNVRHGQVLGHPLWFGMILGQELGSMVDLSGVRFRGGLSYSRTPTSFVGLDFRDWTDL